MKMLKSMVVMATVFSAQSLLAVAMPSAQQAHANSGTAKQAADNTGDKSCPYGKAAAVGIHDITVAQNEVQSNPKTGNFQRGADSSKSRP